MKDAGLFLWGNLWLNLGDHQAGWELIRCLRSPDPEVRRVAHEYLLEAGPRSIKLLQAAVVSSALDRTVAADCLVALLSLTSCDTGECAFADLSYDC